MAKRPDLTRHQRGIVQRYYAHHGTIVVTRLQELVSELYLAEGKKADQLWARVEKSLASIKCEPPLPESRVSSIVEARDVQALATLLTEIDART